MHPQNFPTIFTGLKIPLRFLGSLRAGAGGFFYLLFLHGALTALTIILMAVLIGGIQ